MYMIDYIKNKTTKYFYADIPLIRNVIVLQFLMVLFGASAGPYQTSIQGAYLPIAVIALFALAKQVGGLLQPLLNKFKFNTLAYVVILGDTLEVLTVLLIPDNPELAAWLFSSIFTFVGIASTAFFIKYDVIIAKEFIDEYESYRVNEQFIVAIAAITGVAITIVIQTIFTEPFIWVTFFLGVVLLAYNIQWFKFLNENRLYKDNNAI